ncbi:MAG: tryptophan-rich sensory protein [Spirochaetes bacterium]|nr:tryptophan-rich sensory protein [Spirochaetota bacterium]
MNIVSSRRKGGKAAALLALLLFAVVLTVNTLANALPLNNVTTGALSDEIPNLFVPAGLTFAIWGVIYLLLAGYVAFVLREAWRSREATPGAADPAWTTRDAFLFIFNMAANAAWIFAWQWRQVGLAMVIMLAILGTLIALEQGNQKKLAAGGALEKAGGARRFFLTVPLRVYLGWISVATIANAAALLVKLGWGGFGLDPRFWTVLVIAAGLAVALGFSLWKREIAAPIVVVWAYLGIVLKRTAVDGDYSKPVWIAAAVAVFVILVSLLLAHAGGCKARS